MRVISMDYFMNYLKEKFYLNAMKLCLLTYQGFMNIIKPYTHIGKFSKLRFLQICLQPQNLNYKKCFILFLTMITRWPSSKFLFAKGTNNIILYQQRICIYIGTCVLWTPWDRQKVSRCPHFPGHFI